MPKFFMPRSPLQSGFSYTEILLSVALLGILLVPGLQALNSGISGSGIASTLAARQFNLRSKMEQVLRQPFGKLYAETYLAGGNTTTSVSTNFSDAVGSTNRRVVVFYRFDAGTKALSANDTGLLYVSVYFQSEGSTGALNTLAGRWW
jgi:type II secretory pathway pseudopilin PulG